MQVGAGIVEHVGWTNGSTHNQMRQHGQSFIALHNIDIAAALIVILVVMIFFLAFVARSAASAVRAKRHAGQNGRIDAIGAAKKHR